MSPLNINEILVSVIIPNYNHAPYLKRRIDSVLFQTYTNIEVIIMDDCSTDSSKDIIEQYRSNAKVKHILLNEINSGSPFFQWIKAFDLADGDIIWIAESDDYAEVNFLERLIPFLNSDDKIGLVYCDSNVIDSENKLHRDFYKQFKNSLFKTDKWDTDYRRVGTEEIKENLLFECTINNMSATVFRKQLIKHIDYERLFSFKYCGDWYFLTGLAIQSDIYYVSEALNYFKYGTNNFRKGTKSALNYFKERFLVVYYHWEQLKDSFDIELKKRLYKQLGAGMQIQINETIKGETKLNETFTAFRLLKAVNRDLFNKQIFAALKNYIRK